MLLVARGGRRGRCSRRWWGHANGRDAKQPVVALVNIDRCDVALYSPPTKFDDHACVFAEHIHSFNRIEMIGGMKFLEHVAVLFFKRLSTVNQSVW